jgi:DNA-binding MarR family transcriptional regulator
MSDANPGIMVNEILSLSDRLFRALLSTVPDELLTLDVTMPQMKILLLIYIHGPLRMTTIANDLKVTLPTATSLVDKLVEKSYIQRDTQSDDRRVVLCKLTGAGQKVIGGIWLSARARCQQLLLSMEYAKLAMLKDVLEAMLQSADSQAAQKMIILASQEPGKIR